MFLWVVGSIAVVILVFVLILIPIVLFLIIDAVIYFVLSMMGAVPLRVFMKYHVLTFLEKWDPGMNIPLFDVLENSEELS